MKDEKQTNMKLTVEEQQYWNELLERQEAAKQAQDEAKQMVEDNRDAELETYYLQGEQILKTMAALGKQAKEVTCLFDMNYQSIRSRVNFFTVLSNSAQGRPGQNWDDIGLTLDKKETVWFEAQGKKKLANMTPEQREEHNEKKAEKERKRAEKEKAKAEKAAVASEKVDDVLIRAKVRDAIKADNAVSKISGIIAHAESGTGLEKQGATARLEKLAIKYETDVDTLVDIVNQSTQIEMANKQRIELNKKFPLDPVPRRKLLKDKYHSLPEDAFIEFVMEYMDRIGGVL